MIQRRILGQYRTGCERTHRRSAESVCPTVYNEEDADELMILIRDSFIPAFKELEVFLLKKQQEIKDKLPVTNRKGAFSGGGH